MRTRATASWTRATWIWGDPATGLPEPKPPGREIPGQGQPGRGLLRDLGHPSPPYPLLDHPGARAHLLRMGRTSSPPHQQPHQRGPSPGAGRAAQPRLRGLLGCGGRVALAGGAPRARSARPLGRRARSRARAAVCTRECSTIWWYVRKILPHLEALGRLAVAGRGRRRGGGARGRPGIWGPGRGVPGCAHPLARGGPVHPGPGSLALSPGSPG